MCIHTNCATIYLPPAFQIDHFYNNYMSNCTIECSLQKLDSNYHIIMFSFCSCIGKHYTVLKGPLYYRFSLPSTICISHSADGITQYLKNP